MRIGYGRVSTRDQHPEAQHDALTAAGCQQVFLDKASGKLARRPELDKALLSANRSGDQLVVTKLDRLGRSLEHLIELSGQLQARGVDLVVLDQGIDTSTAVGRMFFHILGSIAEFEHALSTQRALHGHCRRAIEAYLNLMVGPETAGTRRVYAGTLAALAAALDPATPAAGLDEPATAERLSAWFTGRWGAARPATFNRNLDALRSAAGYWRDQGWIGTDPTCGLRRRGRPPDRTRALSIGQVEALLGRSDIGLREKTLWRLLYETAARACEVFPLLRRPALPAGGCAPPCSSRPLS
jgi:hypothetical protein